MQKADISFALYWVDNRDRIRSPMALNMSLNSADYISARAIYQHQMPVHMVVSDDQAIQHAEQNEYQYAIICRFGNVFHMPTGDWLTMLTQHVTENHPVHCMAHLVDERPRAYVKLHHQCVVVNVQTWRQAGAPRWGAGHLRTAPAVAALSRSVENYHDSYTPLWVQHDVSLPDQQCPVTSEGYGIIDAFVKLGIRINGFPTNLRETKMYLYPDVTGDAEDKLQELHQALSIWRSTFCATERIVHTDPLNSTPLVPVRHLIAPAIALQPCTVLLDQGFTSSTKVTVYHSDATSVAVYQNLIKHWDGTDYPAFLKQTKTSVLETPAQISDYWTNIQSQARAAGYDSFGDFWKQIRALEITAVHINPLEPRRFLKRLGNVSNTPDTVFMLTGVYSYFPTAAYTGLFGVFKQASKLHLYLRKQLPDISVLSDDYGQFVNFSREQYSPAQVDMTEFTLASVLDFPWRPGLDASTSDWYRHLE